MSQDAGDYLEAYIRYALNELELMELRDNKREAARALAHDPGHVLAGVGVNGHAGRNGANGSNGSSSTPEFDKLLREYGPPLS